MPRIAGVDIPADKKIKVSLRYIYGVGPSNALVILKEAGIDPERRAKDLSEEELAAKTFEMAERLQQKPPTHRAFPRGEVELKCPLFTRSSLPR